MYADPDEEEIEDAIIDNEREHQRSMVFEDNNVGANIEKEILHVNR